MIKCLLITLYIYHSEELGLSEREKERFGHSLKSNLDLFWRNLIKVELIQI